MVAVDLEHHTIALRTAGGDEVWRAEGKAVDDLRILQPGQRVKVHFRTEDRDARIASHIVVPVKDR